MSKGTRITRRFTAVLLAVAISGLVAATVPAQAEEEWPPAGSVGVKLYATGGPVSVTVRYATAAYDSDLYLASPGPRTRIANNHADVGQTFNIGTFSEGDELVFEIDVAQTGQTFSTGPGDRNPDGVPHAAAVEQAANDVLVGFEDVRADQGSDMDYDDNVFHFNGALTTVQPTATQLVANPAILGVVPSLDVYFPQLSATLSEVGGGPIAGQEIVFSATDFLLGSGAELCRATTDANGVAACGDLDPEEIAAILGVGFEADFAGAGMLLPSHDHGPIVSVAGIGVL